MPDTTQTTTTADLAAIAAEAAPQNPDVREVVLDVPIKRPNGELRRVLVRRPSSGALRGLSLVELLHMNVTAIHTILPRITEPMIHKQEVHLLDPADLVALGTEVAGFLVPKAQRAEFQSE